MPYDENYFGDVIYDVWRSGRDPDAVDRDRVAYHELDGYPSEEAAAAEICLQDSRQADRRYEEVYEEQQQQEVYEEWTRADEAYEYWSQHTEDQTRHPMEDVAGGADAGWTLRTTYGQREVGHETVYLVFERKED